MTTFAPAHLSIVVGGRECESVFAAKGLGSKTILELSFQKLRSCCAAFPLKDPGFSLNIVCAPSFGTDSAARTTGVQKRGSLLDEGGMAGRG